MVLGAWEWLFLKFDLPLQHHGVPHTAPCTMATPWGASYRPVYHGQTHGHPKPPALHLLFATPSSCFATTWTKKC